MLKNNPNLKSRMIETPLACMQAIADDEKLYSLKFITQGIQPIQIGNCAPLSSIEKELAAYFSGQLRTFNTPIAFVGTPFQQQVWQLLTSIPYGQTCSYTDLAIAIGNKKAVRAVAQANGKNNLAIIIPCHRVIYKDGTLGGYAGGLAQKEKLLALEDIYNC